MAPIVQGQHFPSLSEFRRALREWAIERNFTPAILDSDVHRVRAGCRSSTNCPFRIRCNFHEKRGVAKVTTCEDVHTCGCDSGQLVNQKIKRAEACKLSFLVDAVPRLMMVDDDTSTRKIIEIVKEKYGQQIALRQAQKVKALLVAQTRQACEKCGAEHAIRRPCQQTSVPGTDIAQQEAAVGGDDTAMNYELPEAIRVEEETETVESGNNRKNGMSSAINTPAVNGNSRNAAMMNAVSAPALNSSAPTVTNLPSTPIQSAPAIINSAPRAYQPSLVMEPEVTPPLTSPGAPVVWLQTQPQAQPLQPSATARVAVASRNTTAPPTPRTPAEIRMEAARMMQNAARLMQEAARLNAEAARLNASVANS